MGKYILTEIDIIYLHGFASSPASKKAEIFKTRFGQLSIPLIVPDLQEGNFKALTISSQVRVVQKIIDSRAGRRFAVIGSSMGGYLAALLAQLNADVEALYLMAPGFNFIERWKKNLFNIPPESFQLPEFIDVFHYGYNKNVTMSTGIFKDAEKWEGLSLDRQLPTRIAHGLHDDTVDINVSREFVKDRPWRSLAELDSDHSLLSHIDWIVKDCLKFLKIDS